MKEKVIPISLEPEVQNRLDELRLNVFQYPETGMYIIRKQYRDTKHQIEIFQSEKLSEIFSFIVGYGVSLEELREEENDISTSEDSFYEFVAEKFNKMIPDIAYNGFNEIVHEVDSEDIDHIFLEWAPVLFRIVDIRRFKSPVRSLQSFIKQLVSEAIEISAKEILAIYEE